VFLKVELSGFFALSVQEIFCSRVVNGKAALPQGVTDPGTRFRTSRIQILKEQYHCRGSGVIDGELHLIPVVVKRQLRCNE
jgi:hypothetical protein